MGVIGLQHFFLTSRPTTSIGLQQFWSLFAIMRKPFFMRFPHFNCSAFEDFVAFPDDALPIASLEPLRFSPRSNTSQLYQHKKQALIRAVRLKTDIQKSYFQIIARFQIIDVTIPSINTCWASFEKILWKDALLFCIRIVWGKSLQEKSGEPTVVSR